jgi:hypothetical protein
MLERILIAKACQLLRNSLYAALRDGPLRIASGGKP